MTAEMNINTCPQCRRSMRLWALDYRRVKTEELKHLCLRTAIFFRSGECFHQLSTLNPQLP
jgi:hypothetical protein